MAFRVYVTDSLFYQAQEQRLARRYAEMIKKTKKVEEKSAEEIIDDIVTRAGLEVVE